MASEEDGLNIPSGVVPVLEKYETALLLLLGFGGASLLLAVIHKTIRRNVFHDADNVDTAFDAGGQVSTSLTAVTVASQFLWPGDLLQSATITVKSGISGPFWYTVGASMNMVLFPILSVHLKTRAPGAKTFLQIIHARFGRPAHLVFCILALVVNILVIATLLVAGTAIIKALTRQASDEFCVLIIATLFGSYSLVGGLGTTFYVSYFNAVLIFTTLITLIVKILYTDNEEFSSVGSMEVVYARLSNLTGPEGNEDGSLLTFRSENGWTFAIMGVCLTSSLTYCDQAAWQSRIAAKPLQGVIGFLAATFVWIAIPSSIAATTGLAYLSMSASSNDSSFGLSMDDVNEGLVTPFIAQQLLGKTGCILVLTMMSMALMSTGSGEVMAVSSIIVYDIYTTYINPFRKNVPPRCCILCGKRKSRSLHITVPDVTDVDTCTCPHPLTCIECKRCDQDAADVKQAQHIVADLRKYECPYHGDFRHYQDTLLTYKNWCILWVTCAHIPFGLLVKASGVDLNWVMLFGFIVTIPCFPAVALSIFSSKTTGKGVISGALLGMIGGVSAALGVASTYEGGLGKFLENTVQNYSILSGAGTSLGVSFFVTLIVSLVTSKVKTKKNVEDEWNKLREIDNPLHPWSELYRDDFKHLKDGEQPSAEELNKMFKKARIVAYIGGFGTLVFFVGVVPAVMMQQHILSLYTFKVWMWVLQGLCFTMGAVVIVLAPLEEVVQVYRRYRKNKRTTLQTSTTNGAELNTFRQIKENTF